MSNIPKGYLSVLLEEIALEGLDGITLEILWKRLNSNPNWILRPVDACIEEFVWKQLFNLTEISWYELPSPKECPQFFETIEDFMTAVENEKIDPFTYSGNCYPHYLIKDGDTIGSCPAYYQRTDISSQVVKFSLAEVKKKWGSRLVIVASQEVRNFFLIGAFANPEIELSDISYCILERVGRSRRCGELSVGLNFLRNGANPTFYFWNKLKNYKLITSQFIYFSGKLSNATLFYLPRYSRNYTSEVVNSVYLAVKFLKATKKNACLYSDIKSILPTDLPKFPKSDIFRRYIQLQYVKYDEYYPELSAEECRSKNGSVKQIRVAKLVDENVDAETILQQYSEFENYEIEKLTGILHGNRLFNRPIISQCYDYINSSEVNGRSMSEIGLHFGLNKLLTRHLIKLLRKNNLIQALAFDSGRQRYYKYFSKNYWDVVTNKYNEVLKPDIRQSESLTEELDESCTNEQEDSGNMEIDDNNLKVENIESSEKESQKVLSKTNNIAEKASPEENTLDNTRKRKQATEDDKVKSKKHCSMSVSSINKADEKNKSSPPIKLTIPSTGNIYYLRRTNIILEHVYKKHVTTPIELLKVIKNEETKLEISRGTPCRKSINRIINSLVEANKIQRISKVVEDNYLKKSRTIVFVCSPDVTDEHPIIQTHLQQIQKDVSILYLRVGNQSKKTKKKLKEMELSFIPLGVTKENAIKYGYSPKFARMRILHEFLFYLIYHYKGVDNEDSTENETYIKEFCEDLKNEEIPKCYLKEISWKMFIPPLMKYEEYGTGWTSQNDIIERLPIRTLCSLARLTYFVPELDEYLRHPVKQFYLVRHLPYDLQKILTADKKHLNSLSLNLQNLCLVGLTQFGPKSQVHGESNLVYLNKRSMLLDTRISSPTYFQINPDLSYSKYQYDFLNETSWEQYWNDACRFCIGTRLRNKKTAPRKKSNGVKTNLKKYLQPHLIEEVTSYDTGELPGDGMGAAGYDSSLFSHIIKQWFLTSTEKPIPTSHVNRSQQAPIRMRSNLQLKRLRINLQKKPSKSKSKSREKLYDKVDVEALAKSRTLRATWSKEEDEILLMCYLADRYFNMEELGNYKPYQLFRKILHEKSKASFSKTVLSCKRRMYNLMKNPTKKHSANLYLKDILEDTQMKLKFQKTIDELKSIATTKDIVKLQSTYNSLVEQVFDYLYDNSKQKIALHLKGTFNLTLPDSVEKLRENFSFEYPDLLNAKTCRFPQIWDKEISTISIINLIYSTLFSQVDKSKIVNINHLYRIFNRFDDNQLKLALNFVRNNRLISFNRHADRQKTSLLPMGKGTYHFSLTFHTILKSMYSPKVFSLIYNRYLNILSKSETNNMEFSDIDIGLSLVLCAYFVHKQIIFNITIPEDIMIFNSKPLPIIDPENIAKPIFDAKEDYNDSTLALIRETFFKKNVEKLDEKDDGVVFADKQGENSSFDSLSESDSEDEDLNFESNVLEEMFGRRSKLAVFLTRTQFRRSYLRFSNAYDHFLVNKFIISYSLNSEKLYLDIDSEFYANFWFQIEKQAVYKNMKQESDNEITNKIKKYFSSSAERDFAIHVLEFIKSKDVCGADRESLANEFKDLHVLKTILHTLYTKKLVIRCGSEEVHYVHLDFYRSWLIPCIKSNDLFEAKNSSNLSLNKIKTENSSSTNNEETWIIPKPWIQINGTVNNLALQSFITRIISYVVKNPGISLSNVQQKFSPALFPYWVFEVMEMLTELNIVKLNVLGISNRVSLFSKKTETTIKGATSFEERSSIFIEPDVNALLKCSLFFANTKDNDLLETKYALDVSSTTNSSNGAKEKDSCED